MRAAGCPACLGSLARSRLADTTSTDRPAPARPSGSHRLTNLIRVPPGLMSEHPRPKPRRATRTESLSSYCLSSVPRRSLLRPVSCRLSLSWPRRASPRLASTVLPLGLSSTSYPRARSCILQLSQHKPNIYRVSACNPSSSAHFSPLSVSATVGDGTTVLRHIYTTPLASSSSYI